MTTSQVYPTLARLEKLGLIESEVEVQDKRPNKNLHSVTQLGAQVLRDWIGTEPDPPFIRDDFQTMIYSSWTKKPEEVIEIIKQRIEFLESSISVMRKELGEHFNLFPNAKENTQHWPFSKFALVSRRIEVYSQEVIWCHGMINLLGKAVAGFSTDLRHDEADN